MESKSFFADEEEKNNKFLKKAKDDPAMLLGIAGFVIAGAVGAYKYRNRGNMSTSVFLMQLRVAAQGTVVGCLTLGLAYNLTKEYLLNDKTSEKKS